MNAVIHGWRLAAPCGLALALACGIARAATPGVDAPPEPGPTRPVVLPPMAERALPNGLRVVVVPRRDLPLVTAVLLVRHGSEADPPDRAGLAGMTATLVTKGARRGGRVVDATGIARQAEALGATLSAGSGWRSSTLSMTVATPHLGAALALIADVARQPTLAADELERARAQELDGLRVAMSQPGSVASMAARRAFWGGSAYGAATTPASVQRLTREDVQAFHRRWWRADAAVLVLAGDVDEATGLGWARRHFGAWRTAGPAPQAEPPAPPRPLDAPLVVIDMPGSGQAGVVVTGPYAALRDADRRVGQVAATVLGGGYSARLNQEVRIKRGLSYGAGGSGESQPEGGMFLAQAQTKNESGAEVQALLRQELGRVAAEPPTAEELAARQATLVGGFSRRLDTTASLAGLVAGQLSQGLPLADLGRFVAEVLAVTPEQVGRFARTHWPAERLRGVMVIDAQAAGDALKSLPEGTLRLKLADLDLAQPALVRRGP